MKEANFCLEIKHSLERIPGVYYHKIPDPPIFKGAKMRFQPPRPYDCYIVYKGIHYAFEVKLHKGAHAFAVDLVTERQIQELLKVQEARGVAGLIIGYRAPGIQTARYVPINWWLEEVYKKSRYDRRKSFPVGDLIELGYWIKWEGKGLWNFEDLLLFLDPMKKST